MSRPWNVKPLFSATSAEELQRLAWAADDELAAKCKRPGGCLPEHDLTHDVYRYWNDLAPVEHQLLYIGYSHDFLARDRTHWVKSSWRRQATRWRVDVYVGRKNALRAEWESIRAELPVYNVVHTNWEAWHELHGEYVDFVTDKYGPAALAGDAHCTAVMNDVMKRFAS